MGDLVEAASRTPSLVSHVVVVGFHAKLGNRIEFAYPRLRGETHLRSPKLSDSCDISDPTPGSPSPYSTPIATPVASNDHGAGATFDASPVATASHASAAVATPTTFDGVASVSRTPPPHRLPPTQATRNPSVASIETGPIVDSPAYSTPHVSVSPSAAFDDIHSAIALHGSTGIASAKTPPSISEVTGTPEQQMQRKRRFSGVSAAPPPPSSSPPARLQAKGDWGVLPAEWAHLPFMAIPDGAHELEDDLVFFSLPPDVHCISCFRQVDAIDAVNHSASSSKRTEEFSVAARGSVQKSVVLLCRRPLFGFLAARLVPAVRAYFDQRDFASTECLAELYHSLNISLSHPSLGLTSTLFHSISLCGLLRNLGPQSLAVVKLILLEKRVVFYSAPVQHASDSVVAFASLFPGALDSIAPTMPALDASQEDKSYGFPLALFGPRDRMVFQPYAPLPAVTDLLQEGRPKKGCVLGTSHNLGALLASTAASASRKAAAAAAAAGTHQQVKKPGGRGDVPLRAGMSAPHLSVPPARSESCAKSAVLPSSGVNGGGGVVGDREHSSGRVSVKSNEGSQSDTGGTRTKQAGGLSRSQSGGRFPSGPPSKGPPGNSGRLPVVDALVNLGTGKVSVAGSIEPLCRITRQERRLMRDLLVAASAGEAGRQLDTDLDANDYIRERIREYLLCFLGSVADVPGVLGGPRGGETWSSEMASHLDLSMLDEYNRQFAHAWLQTRNAACWARRCEATVGFARPVPTPELDKSLMEESLLPVERVAAGLTGIRESFDLVSSKAAEGLSSLFARLETQVVKANEVQPGASPVGPSPVGGASTEAEGNALQVSRSAPPKVGPVLRSHEANAPTQ